MKLPITLFASSFTIVVAAGLAQLDAGPEADGPVKKPVLGELTAGGHRLAVSLDRERVPAGEPVKLAIVARDGGAGERLRVAVLEQVGSPMSRSMPPPREVSHQDVVIDRDGALSLALTLQGAAPARDGGAGADPLLTAGRATQYTVVVSAAGTDEAGAEQAAYLPVFAYEPEAYRLEIEPIAAGVPGEPVDVVVKVTSLAKQPLRGLTVGASTELATMDEPARLASLAPGAQAIVHLKGTRVAMDGEPGAPAMVQAYGYAEYGGTAAAWAKLDAAKGTLLARASEASDPMLFGL